MAGPSLAAVIVAAGSSQRMGFDKLTASLAGLPLLRHSVEAFSATKVVDSIIIVCAEERREEFFRLVGDLPKVREIIAGGKERVDSVKAGLNALVAIAPQYVAVHDGARPLITPPDITACYEAARANGAAVCAEPVADTLHRTDTDCIALETVDRTNLWRMQTPQILEFSLLQSLLENRPPEGATDEISLLIRAGKKAKIMASSDWNFKVTYPQDLKLAELIVRQRSL